MQEFHIIEEILRPLATDKSALDLRDDAAILDIAHDKSLVVSKDSIVESIHFIENDSPQNIASRILGVNLSDIAAMGAKPLYYMLSLNLPKNINNNWLASFATKLNSLQNKYNISLIGGDTTRHNGKLIISCTIFGEIGRDKSLKRSNAKAGQDIYVSGTIGDSALGLFCIEGKLPKISDNSRAFLEQRYLIPKPRIELGQALNGIADSCIDISDGLVADVEHIAKCSNVTIDIYSNSVPLSEAGKEVLDKYPEMLGVILSGGDDYELLFTASANKNSKIDEITDKTKTKITKIGSTSSGKAMVNVYNLSGDIINLPNNGYIHLSS